ncbi:MAG: hypothetical protein JKX70_07195 [Phycisphaerales bacterium]|nr:hypothetical protein [Phycisphaerales bacterium]
MQVRACTPRFPSQKIAFSLAAGLITLPALAGTPAALDHVPTDAQAVIVVPNLGNLLNDINAVNTLLGDDGEPMIMMVTSMIRGMPGINLEGSLAGVLSFNPEDMEAEPEVVLLLPVTDFGAFAEGHQAQDGVFGWDMGGEMLYFRDAGDGYAVFGDDSGLVSDFNAAAGNLDSNAALLGKAGGRIAESNDIFVYVNFGAFEEVIAQGMEEMEAQGEMVEMMGGAEAAAGFDAMLGMIQTVVNDGASFSMGMSFDQTAGISYDLGLQFKDDSTSASYLQNDGDAGKYFDNMPAMDYFFASAFDMSGDGIQKLFNEYFDMMAKMDTSGMFDAMGIKGMLEGMNGGIQVMGASDNIMGGLFSKTMYYMDVEDGDKLIEATQSMYANMGASMAQLEEVGVKINAAMDEKPTSINGVDAYGYSFAMDMSGISDMAAGMGGPNPAMILGMIFGADGGPSGYMAKAGDGVISTFSKDAEFFAQVADAANGKNTMKGNASIAQTAAMLPDNRISETYFAADHLINTAGPMLMMFGVIPEFEPMDALAPIGMGLTADGGGVLFRLAIPMQTIGAVMEMIPAEAFEDEDDDDMDF